ncbi:MAG: hypothetical protein ACK4FG_06615 [Brevundimonas sp.]
MHWQDLVLLALGAFLTWTSLRDVVAAWRAQCFQKSSVQMWDVRRSEKPVTFWFLIGGHLVMAGLGAYVAVWKGAAILASISSQ